MAENEKVTNNIAQTIPMRFGEGFLKDYAPMLINNPEVAMVEIVSNCWDAGANRIDILWPEAFGGEFSVADDGFGMTYGEFIHIWTELSYNRKDKGKEVIFPPGNTKSVRKIFGRNGKGRLSLFCFDDEYLIETSKDGEKCVFKVTRQYERGGSPFIIHALLREPSETHGTTLSCKASYNHIKPSRLIELIGSKFVSDPAFEIYVNNDLIELTDLDHIADNETVKTPHGLATVYMFDSKKKGRTSQQHGVAWWVNKKSVGKQGWHGPNGTSLIDARTSEAMRYTFIVIADMLEDQVEYDWTGFIENERTEAVVAAVNRFIQSRLDELFFAKRKERREDAIKNNRERLKALPSTSRKRVGKFIDEVQTEIPTLEPKHLSAVVGVFANLEQTRTGYALLEQLAALTPNDFDNLSDILAKWSVQDAQIVLEELERRLKLIEKLDAVVDMASDELHVIHPLIEKGLWIFGYEYESIDFTSNKGLTNVIRKLLRDKEVAIAEPRRRPDFVVLPDSRIGVFSRDSFDDNSEVNGIAKALVIELKRGGFAVGKKEMRQADDYAEAISASGNLAPNAKIVCYVLGTTTDVEKSTSGEDDRITIYPRTYRTVIQQAQARTFNLKRKIEDAKLVSRDPEIDRLLLINTDGITVSENYKAN